MGQFSFICPACDRAINGKEVAHFRHIRHGKVLGETVGYHDGYGRVWGDFTPCDPNYRIWSDEIADKDYPNTHEEICKSEFELTDSIGYKAKIYDGKPYNWMQFRRLFGLEDLSKTPDKSFYDLWNSLEEFVPTVIASGTSAYHEFCFRKLSEEEKEKLVISKSDPDQGWGRELKKYVEL